MASALLRLLCGSLVLVLGQLEELPVLEIPVLALPESPSEAQAAAGPIAQACRDVGMFHATHSRLTAEAARQAWEAHRSVFLVPSAEKEQLPVSCGGFTRGYVGLGAESGSHRLEVKTRAFPHSPVAGWCSC